MKNRVVWPGPKLAESANGVVDYQSSRYAFTVLFTEQKSNFDRSDLGFSCLSYRTFPISFMFLFSYFIFVAHQFSAY